MIAHRRRPGREHVPVSREIPELSSHNACGLVSNHSIRGNHLEIANRVPRIEAVENTTPESFPVLSFT